MRKILILQLLILCFQTVFSQNKYNIDSTKLIYSAKLQVFESKGAICNKKNIDSFLENQKVFFLESKGFSDNYFLLIESGTKDLDTTFLLEKKAELKQNLVYWNCDYILAYNCRTNLYYKLKGFRNNDFKSFINDMIRTDNIIDLSIEDKEIFTSLYFIEDIDLSCLWEYYFGKINKNKNYNCVKSCRYRDMDVEIPR